MFRYVFDKDIVSLFPILSLEPILVFGVADFHIYSYLFMGGNLECVACVGGNFSHLPVYLCKRRVHGYHSTPEQMVLLIYAGIFR